MLRGFLSGVLILAAMASPTIAQPQWQRGDAEELLAVVEQITADGLDPADYDATELRRDLAQADPKVWSSRATDVFLHLASDLSNGHVRNRQRHAWHIVASPLAESASEGLLTTALATHSVRESLAALLPRHRQYRALKAALAATSPKDKAGILRLRANMERWRWMPRDLGERYLLVNVPAFTISLVENGRVIERRRVIVGKVSTPTPQFAALVTGVIFNPWWDVPASIVRESVGRQLRANPALARARGYVVSNGRVRQAPGPANALGQMKLVMPNPFSVYVHDTPSKHLFAEEVRAFSHGCVRTDDALGLANSLIGKSAGTGAAARDSGRTMQVDVAKPVPIYVVYFTAAAEETGEIATFPDIYARDGPVVEGLVDRQLLETHP